MKVVLLTGLVLALIHGIVFRLSAQNPGEVDTAHEDYDPSALIDRLDEEALSETLDLGTIKLVTDETGEGALETTIAGGPNGSRLAEAYWELFGPDGFRYEAGFTDDEGRMSVEFLPAATYRLRVSKAGWRTAEVRFAVRPDLMTEVDVVLEEASESAVEGFVRIPAGTYVRGSPEDEPGRFSDEGPQHSVTVSRDFYLAATPVTWAEWNEVRDWALANGYTDLVEGRRGSHGNDRNTPNDPVTMVSWWDAVKWSNARSQMEGRRPVYYTSSGFGAANVLRTGEPELYVDWNANGYRLPTEAEWEYAARAGTETAFYTGAITRTGWSPVDPNLDEAGWFWGNSGERTHPVGQKQPNAWGLYDMHGNVWEWCWDVWDSDWYNRDQASGSDPRGPAAGSFRVFRGGCWSSLAGFCRSATRAGVIPAARYNNMGFRPVMTIRE